MFTVLSDQKAYLRENLALAWPLAINAILVQSMLMIDTVLVAPLGELSVAAIGIATAIIAFAIGVELAISNGIQLIVGRAYGSRSREGLAVSFWVGLIINLAASLLFFGVLSFFAFEIVSSISQDHYVKQQVVVYLGITKYVVLFTAITQVCTAFYNGCGDTKIALKGFIIEIPINAILSYILIYGLGRFEGLGLEGAAWGTLIAILLRTVYFCCVIKSDTRFDLRYPNQRPLRGEIQRQVVEITPIAANFFVLFIGASVYQLLYAQLELSSFVAITLIFPWLRIGTQLVSSWAQASAINISQALGDKDIEYLDQFISVCTKAAMGLSFLVAALFLLLSELIHLVYPNIAHETYIAFDVIAPLYVVLPIIRGYNSVSGNILRALGESKRILKLHFITQWVISLPVCALLILFFDVSLFWAFAVMLIEELLKMYHFYRYTQRNLQRVRNQRL